MYAADAVDEEIDAMAVAPVDPAEREVVQKELNVMTKLLEKLTYLKARRRAYSHGRSRGINDMNVSMSAHHPSSSIPSAPSA